MKVKVSTLFQTYQIADRIRTEISISREIKEGKVSYGQALEASAALSDVLGNCDIEVELPPEATTVLVPFSQTAILAALSDR